MLPTTDWNPFLPLFVPPVLDQFVQVPFAATADFPGLFVVALAEALLGKAFTPLYPV